MLDQMLDLNTWLGDDTKLKSDCDDFNAFSRLQQAGFNQSALHPHSQSRSSGPDHRHFLVQSISQRAQIVNIHDAFSPASAPLPHHLLHPQAALSSVADEFSLASHHLCLSAFFSHTLCFSWELQFCIIWTTTPLFGTSLGSLFSSWLINPNAPFWDKRLRTYRKTVDKVSRRRPTNCNLVNHSVRCPPGCYNLTAVLTWRLCCVSTWLPGNTIIKLQMYCWRQIGCWW